MSECEKQCIITSGLWSFDTLAGNPLGDIPRSPVLSQSRNANNPNEWAREAHTQHEVVLSYLLMHQSFLQQPDMKREGGEIHNEFQNKTAKIYKI